MNPKAPGGVEGSHSECEVLHTPPLRSGGISPFPLGDQEKNESGGRKGDVGAHRTREPTGNGSISSQDELLPRHGSDGVALQR